MFCRCLSVPVTLRSVINKVSEEIRKEPTPEPVSVTIPSDRAPPWPPEYYSSHFSPGKIPMDVKNISPNNMGFRTFGLQQHSPQGMYGIMNQIHQPEGILIEPSVPEKPQNPLLADLLDRNSPSPTEQLQQIPQQHEAPIMSKLLQDSSTLASSIPQPPQKPKQIRQRKRSSKSDIASVRRSPKHPRLSETESNGSLSHMDFESSGGSFDFGDISNQSQPHSVHSQGHPTLTRQLSIIDLTEVETPAAFSGESNMQKLESMVGNKIPRHPHRQDSELSNLLSDYGDISPTKETESPHHYYHNSVPKNDKVSTSHEDKILSGSREVSKTTDPTSPNYAHQSLIDLLSIKQEEPEISCTFQHQNSNLSHSHNSTNEQKNRKLSVGTMRSSSMSDISDSDTMPYKDASRSNDNSAFIMKSSSKSLQMTASVDSCSVSIKRELKEEKFEAHDLRTLLTIGKEDSKNNVIEKDIKFKKEEGTKNIRLKLSKVQGLRQSSFPNELLSIHKHKSKTPFEFHSDEDDDDPFDFRDKSTMKMISSSPTRLQISGKHKLYNHKLNKDKDKKKESKCNSTSGEKRKKDKYESKKEKKKKQKQLENYKSTSLDESAIYKSVAVVSEDSNSGSNQKPIPKLKINKSSLGISVGKSPSRDILTNKNEIVKKSKDKYDKHLSSTSKKSSQKSKVHQRSPSSSSITVSKADSKLITKTPTIKLKPIAMPTSSSVSIGMAKTPPAYSTASSTKGSSTPTSTTIGRIGAVSLTKSGSLMPPVSVKATTPTSLSKSFPGLKATSKSTSSLPSAGKVSQRSSSSSSNRNSISDNKESKKDRNGSSSGSKFSSDNRKSNSPMAGSRNAQNLSKSSHSSSKNSSSSTSLPFANKNQSAADVLSFLNTNSSVIANLPKIPKLDKANTSVSAGTNKAVSSVESNFKTVTTTSVVNAKTSTSSFSAKMNMTNTTSGSNTKVSVSTNVTSSKSNTSNSVSSSKLNVSNSSPAHTKTVTTPTSLKPNPIAMVTKTNNVIPSSSGSFSRSTVTHTTSNSSKSGTTTSTTTASKMATSVSTTGSSSNKCISSVSQSVSSVKSVTTTSSDSVKKTVQNTTTSSSNSPSTVTTVSSAQSGTQSSSAQSVSQSSANSGNMPQKQRPRKGSLTAVIDKLTKQTSNGPGLEDGKKPSLENDGEELLGNSSSLSDSDKNMMNCKKEKNGINIQNSKLGHEKSISSSKDAKVWKEEKEGKTNSSSPKVKVSDSSKKHGDSPSKSSSGKENKNDDSRNLFTSILKSASESPYSSKEKGPKVNDSKNVTDLSNNDESNTCSTSSQVKNNDKNSEIESSPREKISNSCTNKHSRTPSPKQNPKKFNGETKDTSSESKLSKEDVFKVPTPKAQNLEEKDLEDTENYVVRKKPRISTSKPILSPTSPVSSPENLVIDCQTLSPRTLQNKTNSPNIDMSSEKLVNNAVVKTKITSPFHKVKQSPLHSPIHLHNPGSVSNASPTDIDDDLMNEALLGFGST